MKYRIVEYQGNQTVFTYYPQVQKSFLGIKFWWDLGGTDYMQTAEGRIEEHKKYAYIKPKKIIHNIDN